MARAAPKSSHACKPCRSLKVRCLQSDDPATPCQKCSRSGAECVFEERPSKPRLRREKPDSRARVAALESKLDDLLSQVQVGKQNYPSTDATLASETSLLTPEFQGKIRTPRSENSQSAFSGWSSDEFTPGVLLQRGHLSLEVAERLLNQYRKMSDYFPFVVLPVDISISNMLKYRPFLLHAALAVAASADVMLQKALERSLRENLLKKIMLDGEKTIDLLQGVLVSLAWGHFFLIPKKGPSLQMLQIAISLSVDLGLNLRPVEAKARKIGLSLDHHYQGGDDYFSREARRAYLGCYHFSSINSWIWAKPNNVGYTDYLLQCAISLSADPEFPSDQQILPLIQLSQMGNEYHGVFKPSNIASKAQIDAHRIEAHLRSFQRGLHNFKTSLSSVLSLSPIIDLTYHFVSTYVYEMELLSPFVPNPKAITNHPSESSIPTACPIQIDIMMDCLQSASSFIDIFLEIPLIEYRNISLTQWNGLVYSTVIIYRLSIGTSRIPFWDVQIARDAAKLEIYLEKLCHFMHNATRARLETIPKSASRDLFTLMGLIFENVKNTYERLRRLPQSTSSTDEKLVHAISFPDTGETKEQQQQQQQQRGGEPKEVRGLATSHFQHPCPAFQFWKGPNNSQLDDPHSKNCDLEGEDPFTAFEFDLDTEDSSWIGSLPNFAIDETFSWPMSGT